MKNMLMLCLTGLLWTAAMGQVGQTEWTLVDSERNDREVPCSVWYPEALNTTYPAVVFAHGFVMGPGDYEGLAEALVEAGYVFVSIGTEQGFAPSHEAYGQDLAFVAEEISGNAVGGVLNGSFDGRVAIGGHSMGGGASWLSAESNPQVDAYFVFAPAETNPSAISAGALIEVPALVVSGADDAVTPPATQHEPIYEAAVNSPCRAFVSIPDGGHCGYADPGTLCDFGELGFQGLSHAEQLALSVSVVAPWLDAFLRDDPSGLDGLEQAAISGGLDLTLSCALSVETLQPEAPEVFYQEPPSGLTLRNTTNQSLQVTLWSVYGRSMVQRTLEPGMQWVPRVPNGVYVVTSGGAFARSVIVQ
jgi:dienelactone hydrolase